MQAKQKAITARNRALGGKVMRSLEKRRFAAYYADTAEEAQKLALSLIPEGTSVSWGGSVTLEEIGLLDAVKRGNFTVIDRDRAGSPEERHALMRDALTCDTFLTSFNALSEDGIAINVDGVGNRVAAIAYGPKSVIAVVGMNKVVKGAQDAVSRARNYAAPINVMRCSANPFFPAMKTPCMPEGACGDCKTEDCACSYIVETRMCKPSGRIKIILVGEDLGF